MTVQVFFIPDHGDLLSGAGLADAALALSRIGIQVPAELQALIAIETTSRWFIPCRVGEPDFTAETDDISGVLGFRHDCVRLVIA